MNLKLSTGLFAILLLIYSCEKEFNDLGASLLPSDNIIIEKKLPQLGFGTNPSVSFEQITGIFLFGRV